MTKNIIWMRSRLPMPDGKLRKSRRRFDGNILFFLFDSTNDHNCPADFSSIDTWLSLGELEAIFKIKLH